MSTQVILLERVENLGNMGEIVSVKPGFARNYLLPQKKALRASKDNIAYFEAQKKSLEAANEKSRTEAAKNIKPLEGLNVAIIRQSSESGQLFGSVTARDIADAVTASSKITIDRSMVAMNQNYKMLGLFPITINLHPEVKVEVIINIARNEEEAEIQKKTGRAITEEAPKVEKTSAAKPLIDEENLSAALEDDALEAEKIKAEEKAVTDAAAAKKAATKAEEKAAKAAAKKAAAPAEEENAETVMGATTAKNDEAEDDAE
jgi:large subunit ribosomal protein L9